MAIERGSRDPHDLLKPLLFNRADPSFGGCGAELFSNADGTGAGVYAACGPGGGRGVPTRGTPQIMDTAASLTDELTRQIGDINNFKVVLSRLGQKIGDLTWSWVHVKDSVLLLVSYISFFLLYITVYMANALFVYTWMLLYIFSPILIAAFVLPSLASATKSLFQALLEVCFWKVMWSVSRLYFGALLYRRSTNQAMEYDFLTAILLNLLLAFSVVVTPLIVRGLLKSGIHSTGSALGGAVLGAAALTPTGMTNVVKNAAVRTATGFKPSGWNADKPDSNRSKNPIPRAEMSISFLNPANKSP